MARPSAGRCALRDRRGSVALELAILSVPFFIMLLGVLEISYDLFVQAALDNAVETAARTVQVGTTQGSPSQTSQSIVNAVCPALSKLLNCSQLVVAVAPIAAPHDYATSTVPTCLSYNSASSANGGSINTGTGGQLMLLAAWYNGPSFLGVLVPNFAVSNGNGGLVHRTYASAGFVNEYFSGGQSSGTSC